MYGSAEIIVRETQGVLPAVDGGLQQLTKNGSSARKVRRWSR